MREAVCGIESVALKLRSFDASCRTSAYVALSVVCLFRRYRMELNISTAYSWQRQL